MKNKMDAGKIFIERLNNVNYETWSFRVKMLLINSDLWDHVSTICPEPVTGSGSAITNQAAITTWKSKDAKALANIVLLVDDSQMQLVRKAETAKEAWDSLKAYHQKSTLSNKVSLLKRVCQMKLEDNGDMESHLFQMEETFEKLASLGKNLEEDLRVAIVLASLPEGYNTLTTALEARNEADLTMSLVKSKLLDQFQKVNPDSRNCSEKAMKAVKVEVSCYRCHKPGHVVKNCPKPKKKESDDEDDSENDQAKVTHVSFSAVCLDYDHSWYMDSGATRHMSGDRRFFKNLKPVKYKVRLGHGELIKCTGIGSGEVNTVDNHGKTVNVTIENCLYVPDLKQNLLSIKQLDQNGFEVSFSKGICEVRKDGKVCATAKAIGAHSYILVQRTESQRTRGQPKVSHAVICVTEDVKEVSKDFSSDCWDEDGGSVEYCYTAIAVSSRSGAVKKKKRLSSLQL